MKASPIRIALAVLLVALGALACGFGFYVGQTDDAPGASALGLLLLIGSLYGGWRLVRRRRTPR